MDSLIKRCYEKSIILLLDNSNRYGTIAAKPKEKALRQHYDYIFGRDACISALGMIASGDQRLIKYAKNSLITLAKSQTNFGQIPNSVNPAKEGALFYYSGSIDATLWWLIALNFYHKYSRDKSLYKKYKPKIKNAFKWLICQDKNNCGLLEQCEATDWSDDISGSGRVLYTNTLWVKVLELYGFKKERELAIDGLNNLFLPYYARPSRSQYLQKDIYRIKEFNIIKKQIKKTPYYLNYIDYKFGNSRCDVYGNSLAILFDIASPIRAKKIINYLHNQKVSQKYPVKVLFPSIKPNDYDWRIYMDNDKCLNKPNSYHNGGIWPYIGGFWVMALKKVNKIKLAEQELIKLATANKLNDWGFNEWLHGQTGQAMGMTGQSWNAGMFLLAYHYLKGDIKL